MDITPEIDVSISQITGYGTDGIKVGDTLYNCPIAVFPDKVIPMEGLTRDDVADAQSYELFTQDARTEMLLVGTGASHYFISPATRQVLKAEHGIILDSMDTGAACRTFNILIGEERQVAALILPVTF